MGLEVFQLEGKIAVITGGNRGLGLVMANALAEVGASVVIVSRHEDQACASAQQVGVNTGTKSMGIGADVTDSSQVKSLVQRVIDTYGKIDILVNNAGVNIRRPIEDYEEETWDFVHGVNLKAPYLLSRAVIPYMKQQQSGRIINVSSMLGLVALPERSAYSSSKGGLIQLTKVLALELAPFNVTVNALCPGPFLTELNQPVLDNPEANAFFINHIPLGRWGNPNELKGVITFLASQASSFMTGSTLTVDGGWTAE